MDLNLAGKVALVTGVSQGIGLACARSLLAEGAVVAGTSRSAPPDVAGITHLQLDMTEPGAAEGAVDDTVARLGSLDVLVNNVGSGRISTGFADESDAQWAEVLELNLMTAIRTTRAALPHLVQGGGVVVNVSSVNGHIPSTSVYAYSAGKAAMDNLTVALSKEFARQGVRVVGVAPGPVTTPLWLGPRGVPRPWLPARERTRKRSSTRKPPRYRSDGSRRRRKSATWSHSSRALAPARLRGRRSASTAAYLRPCRGPSRRRARPHGEVR